MLYLGGRDGAESCQALRSAWVIQSDHVPKQTESTRAGDVAQW